MSEPMQSEYTVHETAAYYALRVETIRDESRAAGGKLSLRNTIALDSIYAFLDRIARDDLSIFRQVHKPTELD